MDAEYYTAEGIDDVGEPVDTGETETVDPQHWIDHLNAELERVEAHSGADHRDALKARTDLATAYRQVGEPGLAVPLAVRNVAQAEQFFPHLAPSLRTFRDEVCSEAGYTVSDVKLLTGGEIEEELVEAVIEAPEEALEEDVAEAPSSVAESDLYYEVIRLRFQLQEAQRTIERLRRRNAKLLDALSDDDG